VVVVVVVMVKYCLQELLDLKLAALNDWYLSEKISSRTYLLSVYERIVFTWVAYQVFYNKQLIVVYFAIFYFLERGSKLFSRSS
jgi:hypothetical protein